MADATSDTAATISHSDFRTALVNLTGEEVSDSEFRDILKEVAKTDNSSIRVHDLEAWIRSGKLKSAKNSIVLVSLLNCIIDFNREVEKKVFGSLEEAQRKRIPGEACHRDLLRAYPVEHHEQLKKYMAAIDDPAGGAFLASLDPMPGALEKIMSMQALGLEVFIETGSHSPTLLLWVLKKFGKEWYDRCILAPDLSMVVAHIVVGDNTGNTELISSGIQPSWRVLEFNQPWNAQFPQQRVDWTNMEEHILKWRFIGANDQLVPRLLPTKKIVYVDMDNTLNDFNKRVTELLEARSGGRFKPARSGCARALDNFDDEEAKIFGKKMYAAEGFNKELKLLDGAKEALLRLQEKYYVFILTAPPTSDFSAVEKFEWIHEKLGPEWTARLVVTEQKTLLYGHVLFDDAPVPKGTKAVRASWTHIAFDQPWNQEIKLRANWANVNKVLDDFFTGTLK